MHFRSFIVIAIISGLVSCSAEKIWVKKIQPEAVPKDVKNGKYVLLVERPTWSKTEEKQIEDFMASYPGRWEMVAMEELNKAKYTDSTKYRYFLKRNPNGYVDERSASAPGGSNASASDRQFWSGVKDKSYVADQIFVDRMLKKEYPSTGIRMITFSRPVKYLVTYIGSM